MAPNVNTTNLPIASLTGDAVVEVPPEASLAAVAAVLVDADVGAVVVRTGDRPSGVVSERDLVRSMAAGHDPTATRAADVAHTDLVWCDVEATVGEVAELMMQRWVRHVLVGGDDGLAGIVSARDLLGLVAGSDPDD